MAEMIRFDESQLSKVRSLIRKRCCNFHKGECQAIDFEECNACPQWFSLSLNCKWFRDAVLPGDSELEAAIYRGDKATRRCIVCKGRFIPGSNRAKYCPACAKKRRQQKERDRLHKRYLKSRI